MKNSVDQMLSSLSPNEKISAKTLMEKMGLTKKEYVEISSRYGVNASKLIELMEMSKYRFVHTTRSASTPLHTAA